MNDLEQRRPILACSAAARDRAMEEVPVLGAFRIWRYALRADDHLLMRRIESGSALAVRWRVVVDGPQKVGF
jgi:hypothetical protein